MKDWKIITGHGLGLRPTRKEHEATIRRERYREKLKECRKKYGKWIPFGYNLDLLEKIRQL